MLLVLFLIFLVRSKLEKLKTKNKFISSFFMFYKYKIYSYKKQRKKNNLFFSYCLGRLASSPKYFNNPSKMGLPKPVAASHPSTA